MDEENIITNLIYKKYINSIELAVKEQSHPSSEGLAAHHQSPQARNSFHQTRDILDRPLSKIPQRALDKQQTYHIYLKSL